MSSKRRHAAPQSSLQGKTAVITGASRGLGKAIATVLAKAGACSIVIVRDRSAGEAVVKGLESKGYRADLGLADVTDHAQVAALAMDLLQRHPVVDILVNNAGVFFDDDRAMRPSHMDLAVLGKTLSVNLFASMRMCDALGGAMPKGGRIINVSSSMGQLAGEPDGYGPCYSISKAALNMYTQQLAADLRERSIMVDVFDPGWVKTDMGGPGAALEPERAAQTALYLATRPASSRTGLFWRGEEVIDW